MNKIALSPLTSTLVLIFFAVALGAVVISWGSSEVQLYAPGGSCEDTILSVLSIDDAPQICYSDNQLEFTAENRGTTNIEGIKLVIIGENDITRLETKTEVLIGDVEKDSAEFNDVGKIRKIILIPKIIYDKMEELCPKNGVDIEDVGECQNEESQI